MSTEKVAIVYIGPKERKEVKRQIFRQHKPVEVEEEFASHLLKFPTVFIEEKYLSDHLEKLKEDEKAKLESEAAKKAQLEAEAKARDMNVRFSNEKDAKVYDIAKMTTPKIRTLLESHDINDEMLAPQDPQEKASDYKIRVRDFLRERFSQE